MKQESFSAEFTLKEIGIATGEFEMIHDALHDHRIEFTVPSIVQTVLESGSGKRDVRQEQKLLEEYRYLSKFGVS